jgi:competence protein ComEC
MPHLSSLLTTALVAGLAGGLCVDAPFAFALLVTMSAAWAGAVLAYLREYPRVLLAALAVLVAGAGWILGAHAVDRALHSPLRVLLEHRFGGFALDGASMDARLSEPVVIEGRLRDDATLVDGGAVMRLETARVWVHGSAERASGGVSLGVSGELQSAHIMEWRAGRVIRAPALLRRPARYLNEGLPDQERVLARRGVSLVGSIKSASLVEVVGRARWWEEAAARVRARARSALARHVRARSDQSAAIATAILIGDRAGLSVETEQRLQEAGTYHVIAISGGNIAILTGLLIGVMALAGVRGRVAWLGGMGVLAAYGVIASGGPSVLRATLMAVVYLGVRLIDQRTAAANAISLTAAVILLASPLQLLDVGFWFTFGATIALVCAAALTLGRSRTKGTKGTKDTKDTKGTNVTNETTGLMFGVRGALVAILVGTACVELALAPVGALVFQRVTIAGLLLNFAALPAMTVVQLGAMAVVAWDVLGIEQAAHWTGYGVHIASLVLTESTRLLDLAPWLTWRVPAPRTQLVAGYYVALCATVVLFFRASRRRAAMCGAVAVALYLWILAAPDARMRAYGDGRLHVSMLDVGQGDAVFVTFPNGRTLLIDAGGVARGTFDIGDRVVGPSLRARRLVGLDYLAVTHADADHVGGARSILRDFGPREVWWGVPVANHAPTEALRAEAARQRAAWRTLQRGDGLEISGVKVFLHHPPRPDWERQRVRNNDSLVVELRYGGMSVLVTGDVDRDVEQELAAILDPGRLVVLKVAHHGSATSSSHAFLQKIQPAIALIGVGRGNPYGHPAPWVLGRLHDVGAEVFRTDLDGQIDVVTDGNDVEVKTWTGRKVRR